MLHITHFHRPNCLPCSMLENEIELLQLDTKFTTPFTLHRVNVDVHPEYIKSHSLKKLPSLFFEIVPDPLDHSPSTTSPHTYTIGNLQGFHRKKDIISTIDRLISLRNMMKNSD